MDNVTCVITNMYLSYIGTYYVPTGENQGENPKNHSVLIKSYQIIFLVPFLLKNNPTVPFESLSPLCTLSTKCFDKSTHKLSGVQV